MAVYLGESEKLTLTLDGYSYKLKVSTHKNEIRLLSSDGYTLKDKDGIYLLPKESE